MTTSVHYIPGAEMGELAHQLARVGGARVKSANPRGLWRIGRALQAG